MRDETKQRVDQYIDWFVTNYKEMGFYPSSFFLSEYRNRMQSDNECWKQNWFVLSLYETQHLVDKEDLEFTEKLHNALIKELTEMKLLEMNIEKVQEFTNVEDWHDRPREEFSRLAQYGGEELIEVLDYIIKEIDAHLIDFIPYKNDIEYFMLEVDFELSELASVLLKIKDFDHTDDGLNKFNELGKQYPEIIKFLDENGIAIVTDYEHDLPEEEVPAHLAKFLSPWNWTEGDNATEIKQIENFTKWLESEAK